MNGLSVLFPLTLAAAALSAGAAADELLLKNGSRIIGTLVSAADGHIVFDTPFAGKIEVGDEDVERIATDESVTLRMQDGAVLREQRLVSTGEGAVALSADGSSIRFNPGEIAFVNPEPWRIGEGYQWFGDANTALASEQGNTDTDKFNVDFESVWRGLADRYTLRGDYELGETEGDRNKNQWNLRGKYDRFRRENADDYYGVQVAFAYDEFADIDLRTTTSLYIGRQFLESEFLTLAGEVGVARVDEQFDTAGQNDFWGGNWELRVTVGLLPWLDLEVGQVGVLNFDAADELLADTRVGVGFPAVMGIKSSIEALWEYDGGAVEGVDETDKTYTFRLGYEW